MVVIWGLNLKEMQWGKFKSGYMWNNEYHMRRTRFIVYQCAMIFCVVSESLGTAALSDYVDQQNFVETKNPKALVHNNDFIGIASYNIFVGVYVATIFGAAFFFDLFWPERFESHAVQVAWRVCSVFACLFTLSAALGYTIILATHQAYVTGVPRATGDRLLHEYHGSPLRYRDNGRAIASVVFLWPGFISTVASTFLLWHSLSHINAVGPKSTHARSRDELAQDTVEKQSAAPSAEFSTNGALADGTPKDEPAVAPPEPALSREAV